VALAHTHDAHRQRDVKAGSRPPADDELRRGAPDVDEHRRLARPGVIAVALIERGAPKRQQRLFVAGQHVCIEPKLVAYPLRELDPV
jgi:hypothetical protein